MGTSSAHLPYRSSDWRKLSTLPGFQPDPNARFGTFVSDITPDGRYMVFSTAIPLTEDDLPEDQLPTAAGDSDVFVLDRASGIIERISIATSGNEGQGSSAFGRISDDGRYVTFWSEQRT